MAMNPNVGMANMNPMGGPVGAPMPMMNNGAVNPQVAAAAARQQQQQFNNETQRTHLNTCIYEYFLRYGMYDCARSLLNSEQCQVNVDKEAAARRNGASMNGVEDSMDTDSKDDIDSKLPDDLPPPKLPMPHSDSSFLYEWFCLFWDIHSAQRAKGGNGAVNQYVSYTQQQSRQKQNEQQAMLRQMRPDQFQQQQQQLMRNMQNGNMNQSGTLARKAMANNQNPQMQMLQQHKQNQMQPGGMDPNRERPTSPASGEGAPSPSKRQRIEGQPFNPNQAGAMMANGRPVQGLPGQPMPNQAAQAAAHQMLVANGINPNTLNAAQLQNFVTAGPGAQAKSIAAYSQNLQQQQGSQMPNKQMPNGGPQGQGSPSMQMQGGEHLAAYYNTGDMGPGGMRPGANGAPNPPGGAGSNHALQDYQMQLMLLEQQNKKRLMMARQEQDNIGGPAPGQPGAPGPNGQPFPDSSTSPNPADQMKRGTPQMNSSGIPSPVPEGGQSRGSPNPAMNFMGNQVDPSMAPHFNMAAQAQMNGMRPPSSHPGQPFNPQMMAQQRQAQQQGQPGGQGNPQWQQGPNGQMMPQTMPQNPQMQGTPQQRAMPPPSAPPAAGNGANSRTTASPQQAAAAPPTPNQGNKAGPKKKETKSAKSKANQKKGSQNNAAATPASENNGDGDAAPPTPITPVNPGNFAKNGQNGAAAGQPSAAPAPAPTAASAPPPSAGVAPGHGDPNGSMGRGDFNSMVDFGSMELANPAMSGDVLSEFDFDSFLHDGDANTEPFDFNPFSGMEGGEIGAD